MICMTFRSRPRLILKDSCLYRVFTWGRGYVVLYNMGYVFASHTPMYMRQGILIIDVFVHPDPVGSESILRLLKAPKGSLNKKINCFGRGYG